MSISFCSNLGDPCIGKSCGNAACHVNSDGKAHCVCVTGGKDTILVRPDENLNCPGGDTDQVIRNISNEHLPIGRYLWHQESVITVIIYIFVNVLLHVYTCH